MNYNEEKVGMTAIGVDYEMNCNEEKVGMTAIGVDYDKYIIRKKQFVRLLEKYEETSLDEALICNTAKHGSRQSDEEFKKGLSFIFGRDVELPNDEEPNILCGECLSKDIKKEG